MFDNVKGRILTSGMTYQGSTVYPPVYEMQPRKFYVGNDYFERVEAWITQTGIAMGTPYSVELDASDEVFGDTETPRRITDRAFTFSEDWQADLFRQQWCGKQG